MLIFGPFDICTPSSNEDRGTIESIWQIWIKWQSGLENENVTSFLAREPMGFLIAFTIDTFSYLMGLNSEFNPWLFVNNS